MAASLAQRQFTISFLVSILLTVAFILNVTSAPLRDIPQKLVQPDGTVLHCYASGDEYHNWLHDANGFTIIQHPATGFYVYAHEINGTIEATDHIAGMVDPADVGLSPHVNISADEVMRIRESYNEHMREIHREVFDGVAKQLMQQSSVNQLNNIVIFIRFSDEEEFTDEITFYDDLYNARESDRQSLYNYYVEASYNQLEIESYFFPEQNESFVVSYQDSHPRGYYRPYNATTNPIGYDTNVSTGNVNNTNGRTYREHTLLRNAISAVADQIPTTINLDRNNNGYVDCVSFIIKGGPDGWNSLLWPHRWVLWSQTATIHGKRVWDYTFQLEKTGNNMPIRLGTVAHEMFHILGAPDLYRYTTTSLAPVGPWDLMASTYNTPQHMSAYMKYYYGGWIAEIPEITESGVYEINPLTHPHDNCFRIPSAYSYDEYFVVEFRKKNTVYESVLPGEGLIIYRINTKAQGSGNAHGPPDEVYVYRPGGSMTATGQLSSAHFSYDVNRTSITDYTSPSAFLSDGSKSGLSITDISSLGDVMSFTVEIEYLAPKLIQHDTGSRASGIGPVDNPRDFEVAVRFTEDDLSSAYGRKLEEVHIFIRQGGGNDVTVKIWEDGMFGNPGTIVYQKNIASDIVYNTWTHHSLEEPVFLKDRKEYWIGYRINATGGYPAGTDQGPMVPGRGGWIRWSGTWQQLTDWGSDFDYNWKIRGVINGGVTLAEPIVADVPESPALYQNYPNPFNPSTVIRYAVPVESYVKLEVYNTLGQVVEILIDEQQPASVYEATFDGSGLASGVYFYRLQINNSNDTFEQTKRFVLLK